MASPGIRFMSGWLVGVFAKWSGLGEFARRLRHIGAFAPQILVDGPAQTGVGNVMRRISGLRKIAARELVLTLRTGLDGLEVPLNRKIDRLIVADLEMQERVMLDRAPVTAEQGIGPDKIDGAGDPAAIALGHDQQHVFGHVLADQRKERAGQVRPAPFARAGLHVELKEGVPGIFGDVAAGKRVNRDACRQRLAPLALDRLAVTRIEGGEEILEAAITLVMPVELLVGTLQEALFGEKFPLGFARERHMDR